MLQLELNIAGRVLSQILRCYRFGPVTFLDARTAPNPNPYRDDMSYKTMKTKRTFTPGGSISCHLLRETLTRSHRGLLAIWTDHLSKELQPPPLLHVPIFERPPLRWPYKDGPSKLAGGQVKLCVCHVFACLMTELHGPRRYLRGPCKEG